MECRCRRSVHPLDHHLVTKVERRRANAHEDFAVSRLGIRPLDELDVGEALAAGLNFVGFHAATFWSLNTRSAFVWKNFFLSASLIASASLVRTSSATN